MAPIRALLLFKSLIIVILLVGSATNCHSQPRCHITVIFDTPQLAAG
jgi:hypothetical protein